MPIMTGACGGSTMSCLVACGAYPPHETGGVLVVGIYPGNTNQCVPNFGCGCGCGCGGGSGGAGGGGGRGGPAPQPVE